MLLNLTSVRKRFGSESGSMLVIAAVTMGVVLFLGTLAVNAGNWFTHKRQLQNRADAGAFAAGVGYEKYWMQCVGSNSSLQASAATAITSAAHLYAGDPTVTGAYNTQVANQQQVNVNVNQTAYGPGGADGSDGGGPCFNHPANPADNISPQGGYWADVKVNEGSVPLLLTGLGISSQITARARVEVRPALSESSGFVPLGVPVPNVAKARVVFYNQCTDPNETGPGLAAYDLHKLSGTLNGWELWGNPNGGGANQTVSLPLPTMAGCSSDYVPIGVQMRIGGTPSSNLTTCTNAQFTGCFKDLSEIRAWPNSDPTTGPPLFGDVKLTGNGATPCSADAYFSRIANCTTGVAVSVDWGDRDNSNKNVSSNFSVSVNGKALSPPGPNTPSGVWTRPQNDIPLGASGPTPMTITWSWTDNDPTHSWRTQACTKKNTPCQGSSPNGGIAAHQGFVATDTNAGVVEMIKATTSVNVDPNAGPVSQFDSLCISGGSAACLSPPGPSVNVYFTVGLDSGYSTGTFATLRVGQAQGTQLLDCDNNNNGQVVTEFANGCSYYYGANTFSNGTWWNTATQSCPSANNFPTNTSTNPWLCVATDPGGHNGKVPDGIAIRTGNCTSQQNNGCSRTSCLHPSNYTAYASGAPIDPTDPRIVEVFIVPYGAFTGINGNGATIPVVDFATFYVTGWGGNGANDDPCKNDDPAASGEIVGRFIAYAGPNTGPTDSNAVCTATLIRPCRVVLVR